MAISKPPRQGLPADATHDDYARDLARHISRDERGGYKTWRNIILRGCRTDVFAVRKTFNMNQQVTITAEVKVSRTDFLSDVRAGKWRAYTAFSTLVYFAAPAGVITPEELPDKCGLYLYRNGRWWEEVVPHSFQGELSVKDWMKLAFGEWQKGTPIKQGEVTS